MGHQWNEPEVEGVPRPPELVYLDYNATTPVAPQVLEAMLPWFTQNFGNAASPHPFGRTALDVVEQARESIARAVGASSRSIHFTSGATEANNLAIRGVEGRCVTAATEHKAVLETVESIGGSVVPVLGDGTVDFDALDDAARGASLVSVMMANNETGVLQDIPRVVDVARRHGCLVHTDATQALGRIDIDLAELGVDLASFSAHKAHGPKGVGALYVRRGVRLSSIMTGGGHERGLRSGTLNVPAIVGFGAAATTLPGEAEAVRQRRLLDDLVVRLEALDAVVLSDHHRGLPNTLSIRFPGADAEAVMAQAHDVAVAAGSACTASVPSPSHVLTAMGLPASEAFETLRISIGRPTGEADIEKAALSLVRAVSVVREMTNAGVGAR